MILVYFVNESRCLIFVFSLRAFVFCVRFLIVCVFFCVRFLLRACSLCVRVFFLRVCSLCVRFLLRACSLCVRFLSARCVFSLCAFSFACVFSLLRNKCRIFSACIHLYLFPQFFGNNFQISDRIHIVLYMYHIIVIKRP